MVAFTQCGSSLSSNLQAVYLSPQIVSVFLFSFQCVKFTNNTLEIDW